MIQFSHHRSIAAGARILTWVTYPARPFRKNYPLRCRGERGVYKVTGRTDA